VEARLQMSISWLYLTQTCHIAGKVTPSYTPASKKKRIVRRQIMYGHVVSSVGVCMLLKPLHAHVHMKLDDGIFSKPFRAPSQAYHLKGDIAILGVSLF
jgi:hypothetical protein